MPLSAEDVPRSKLQRQTFPGFEIPGLEAPSLAFGAPINSLCFQYEFHVQYFMEIDGTSREACATIVAYQPSPLLDLCIATEAPKYEAFSVRSVIIAAGFSKSSQIVSSGECCRSCALSQGEM